MRGLNGQHVQQIGQCATCRRHLPVNRGNLVGVPLGTLEVGSVTSTARGCPRIHGPGWSAGTRLRHGPCRGGRRASLLATAHPTCAWASGPSCRGRARSGLLIPRGLPANGHDGVAGKAVPQNAAIIEIKVEQWPRVAELFVESLEVIDRERNSQVCDSATVAPGRVVDLAVGTDTPGMLTREINICQRKAFDVGQMIGPAVIRRVGVAVPFGASPTLGR